MHRNRKFKFLLITLGVVISFGLILSPFIWERILVRERIKTHYRGEAVTNVRQIGLALMDFDSEFGRFPSPSTGALVEKQFDTATDLSGTSSNAIFRQLVAAEITKSGQIFYAKIPGTHKIYGSINIENALEPGACGFSYISGLSSIDDPTTPLVLTPLLPGTTKFDPIPFDGFAVVLHIDNSAHSYKIEKDGHIYRDGINLLSAKHPIWKGKTPDIRYPE